MKKLLALLLALMMLLSFAACDSEDDDSSSSSRKKKKSTEESSEVTEQEETEEEESQAEETEETEEETEPEPVETDEYVGVIDGQTYENALTEIGCTFDSDWAVATHEEAAELLGLTSEYMGIEALMESSGVFCDLYALYSDGTTSVNIMVQAETFQTEALDDEALMEANEASLPAILESTMGLTVLETEIDTIDFAGTERYILWIHCSAAGVDFYEAIVLVREGGYMYNITAASSYDDMTDDIFSLFYEL